MDELLQLYQQMIIDHGQHPRNFGEIDNPTFREKGHNPFCGDQLEMFIVVDDDKCDKACEVITKAAYTGKIGDGKIFISNVDEAIRIRTSETGSEAI